MTECRRFQSALSSVGHHQPSAYDKAGADMIRAPSGRRQALDSADRWNGVIYSSADVTGIEAGPRTREGFKCAPNDEGDRPTVSFDDRFQPHHLIVGYVRKIAVFDLPKGGFRRLDCLGGRPERSKGKCRFREGFKAVRGGRRLAGERFQIFGAGYFRKLFSDRLESMDRGHN